MFGFKQCRAFALAVCVVMLAACASGPVMQQTRSGVKYVDLVVGAGTRATPAHYVAVHYTGWLQDGTQFDSTRERNEPMVFALGIGAVIIGWEEGVAGMRVGGKRRLVIPPRAAYGKNGVPGSIPPNATLTFEVELISVR